MSSALEERKLRGVYELLDDGHPQLALVELQKHIKRSTPTSANSPLVQAVRCLCLQRTGEEKEAMEVFAQMIESEKERMKAEEEDQKVKVEEAQKKDKVKAPTANKSKGKGKGKGKGGKHLQPQASEQEPTVKDDAHISSEPRQTSNQDQSASNPTTASPTTERPTEPVEELDAPPSRRQGNGSSLVGDVMFDDRVLGCLAFALKPMRQYEHLLALHQNSWLTDPSMSNMPNGEQYFLYCVRLGRWREAHEVALSLWGCTQDSRFTRWAGVCSYLQTTDHRSNSALASETASQKSREDELYDGISLFLHGGSPSFEDPESLLFYISISRKLSALILGDGTETVVDSSPNTSDQIDQKTGMTKQERCRRAERIVLELLTPSIDRLANLDLEGDEGPEFLRERVERVKRDRAGGQRAMKDLRFKWARWELIEMVARREAIKLRALAGSAGSTSELSGKSDEGESMDWDWEMEWERLDDAIRGAEDLPETNYKAYMCYLAVLDVLLAKGAANSAGDSNVHLQATRKTLRAMAEKYGSTERAPMLALLEVSNESISAASSPERLETDSCGKLAICKVYWERFGHKGMAFDDMKSHWPNGKDSSGQAEIEYLATACADEPDNMEAYARRLNAEKLFRYLSDPLPYHDEVKTAGKYWNLYLAGARYAKGIPTTDVRIADDFGVLAAQALISAASQSDKAAEHSANDLLLLAILLLEKVVRDSPSSSVGRVLLIRLFRLLGGPSLVMPHVDLLKMRHFQQDTVLHMVTERLSAMAMASSDKSRGAQFKLLDACRGTYRETEHEITEGIVACFGDETFSQIEGMLDLQRDLHMSLQQEIVKMEDFKRCAIRGETVLLADSVGEASKLRDIRDWDLVPDYGSKTSLVSIRDKTTAGPIMNSSGIASMVRAWRGIMSLHRREGETGQETHVTGSALEHVSYPKETAAERALKGFASNLETLGTAWKTGTVGATGLTLSFKAILEAPEPETWGAWQGIHRWSTLIEAWTMFEIVAGPLKPAKKAKKAAKGDSDPVNEAIKVTTDGLQSVLKVAAEQAKAALSEDPVFKEGQLARTLAEFDVEEKTLISMVKGVETTIRDSRRTAFKELAAALKRRIES